MKWNFRIVDLSSEKEQYREICEVYYDPEGDPIAFCAVKVGWHPTLGQSGLKLLEMLNQAFNKPVLKGSDLKDKTADPPEEE